jgi:hypothetical protein
MYIISTSYQLGTCECVHQALIFMYAKCVSMEGAWGVFNKLQSQDVVTRTSMILGHDGQARKVLELSSGKMQPDDINFVGSSFSL